MQSVIPALSGRLVSVRYIKKKDENIWIRKRRKIFGEGKYLDHGGDEERRRGELSGKGKTRSSEMIITPDINNHIRSLDYHLDRQDPERRGGDGRRGAALLTPFVARLWN